MKTTKLAAVAAAAITLSMVPLGPASAAPAQPSSGPAAVCAELAKDTSEESLYGFIGTKPGACQSTVASVGLEALGNGAFPSRAAAVGNCKALEPSFPTGYPYQFYAGLYDNEQALMGMLTAPRTEDGLGLTPEVAGALADEIVAIYTARSSAFVAKNRSGCVTVLQGLHSGELLGPIFALLAPYMGPPQQ